MWNDIGPVVTVAIQLCYLQRFRAGASRQHPGSELGVLAEQLQFVASLPQHRVQAAAVRFGDLLSHRRTGTPVAQLGHGRQGPGLCFAGGVFHGQHFGQQHRDCGRLQLLLQMGVFTQDLQTAGVWWKKPVQDVALVLLGALVGREKFHPAFPEGTFPQKKKKIVWICLVGLATGPQRGRALRNVGM